MQPTGHATPPIEQAATPLWPLLPHAGTRRLAAPRTSAGPRSALKRAVRGSEEMGGRSVVVFTGEPPGESRCPVAPRSHEPLHLSRTRNVRRFGGIERRGTRDWKAEVVAPPSSE